MTAKTLLGRPPHPASPFGQWLADKGLTCSDVARKAGLHPVTVKKVSRSGLAGAEVALRIWTFWPKAPLTLKNGHKPQKPA